MGSNVFSSSANYGSGPQPVDSKGNPFSTPLAAGSVSNSLIVTAKRNTFWGCAFTGYSNVSQQYNCQNTPVVPHIAIHASYGDLTSLFTPGTYIKVIQNDNQVKYTQVQLSIWTTVTGMSGYWTLVIPTSHNYTDCKPPKTKCNK